jgi:hypothetical protein
MLLLAIWLIVHGLILVAHLSFAGVDIVMGCLAIAAGVCILIGK